MDLNSSATKANITLKPNATKANMIKANRILTKIKVAFFNGLSIESPLTIHCGFNAIIAYNIVI